MGSFSIWHWLIVLVIIAILFGTKKLATMGKDVGEAVKNFKNAMNNEEAAVIKSTKPKARKPRAKNNLG